MAEENPTPLQASFWLTDEEKRYVLVIFTLLFIGLVARYLHSKNRAPEPYIPAGIEKADVVNQEKN